MSLWDAERQAFEHIEQYHLKDGKYVPLLEWSTPVEELAHMHVLGLCEHPFSTIYI